MECPSEALQCCTRVHVRATICNAMHMQSTELSSFWDTPHFWRAGKKKLRRTSVWTHKNAKCPWMLTCADPFVTVS